MKPEDKSKEETLWRDLNRRRNLINQKSQEEYIQFLEHKINTEIEGRKICYRNLSLPLKMAVVGGLASVILFALAFIVGFIDGFFSTV